MSTTFVSNYYPNDPAFHSFTWNGNQQFFLPSGPNDQILWTFINPADTDPVNHNTAIEFMWRHFDSPAHVTDWLIWLTFAPDGRWLEQVSALNANPSSGYELSFEGRRGLHYYTPPHLPPDDKILAEGTWAPHHHAAHHAAHHDGWLLA